jgi:hypothetical protein
VASVPEGKPTARLDRMGKKRSVLSGARSGGIQTGPKTRRLQYLDTGHFALEEDAPFIIQKMRGFLKELT